MQYVSAPDGIRCLDTAILSSKQPKCALGSCQILGLGVGPEVTRSPSELESEARLNPTQGCEIKNPFTVHHPLLPPPFPLLSLSLLSITRCYPRPSLLSRSLCRPSPVATPALPSRTERRNEEESECCLWRRCGLGVRSGTGTLLGSGQRGEGRRTSSLTLQGVALKSLRTNGWTQLNAQ